MAKPITSNSSTCSIQFSAGSQSDQILIDAYVSNGEDEADKLADEEARAAQRLFIRQQKRELEKESVALRASGKDTPAIGSRIDFLVGEYELLAKENGAKLTESATRRKTEQAARNGFAPSFSQAIRDIEGGLSMAYQSEKAFEIPKDSRFKLVEDAKWKWRGSLSDVSSSKKPDCKKSVQEFGIKLEEAQKDHDKNKLPLEVSTKLLEERRNLYSYGLSKQCPKMNSTEQKIDEAIQSMRFDLSSVPEGRKARCEKRIEGYEKRLEAMKTGFEEMNVPPDVADYLIRQEGGMYTQDFKEQCLSKK